MNKGDHIIFDSVRTQVRDMFPDASFYELPTQMPISKRVLKWYSDIELRFVCGTNLLKNRMLYEMGRIPHFRGVRQWDIERGSSSLYGPAILLGCGWQRYQEGHDRYSEKLWNTVLDSRHMHSVRDEYTKEKLAELGITNVLNTGCPTLWKLTREHCSKVPAGKASRVVTTVTDYLRDEKADQRMLDILCRNYDRVYIWLQGYDDGAYLRTLDFHSNMEVIGGDLDTYDRLLEEQDTEFAGTRLHGGIRALQHGRRATFVAIDNRTIEMGRNFGLNYLERSRVDSLDDYLKEDHQCEIELPDEEIKRFKAQFGDNQQ